MGPTSAVLGASLGHMAGTYLGKKQGDDYKGQTAIIGSTLGGLAGGLIPTFKNGGRVMGKKKGEPKLAILHTGEWVLPISIPPTKEQKSKIEKQKKIKKEKIPNMFV